MQNKNMWGGVSKLQLCSSVLLFPFFILSITDSERYFLVRLYKKIISYKGKIFDFEVKKKYIFIDQKNQTSPM